MFIILPDESSNLEISEALQLIYDQYSMLQNHVSNLSSDFEDSWVSLCELINNYKKWLANYNEFEIRSDRGFNSDNFLDKINSRLREYLIIKASSNIEIAMREYVRLVKDCYFPADLFDSTHDNFSDLRKRVKQELGELVPFGKNAHFSKVKGTLRGISTDCSNCFEKNFGQAGLSPKVLNKIVNCRNDIAHGAQNIDSSDKLFLLGLIYSFEVSRLILEIPMRDRIEYSFESRFNFKDDYLHQNYIEELNLDLDNESIS